MGDVAHGTLDLPSSSAALLTGFLLGMTLAPLESAPEGARPQPGPWLAPLAVVVMICGALWTQVKPPPYYASELRRDQAAVRNFERANVQLADRIDDFLKRASASAIPNPVLADELRDQHLPAWRSLRRELDEAASRRELPLANRLALAKRYVEARIAYLENASEALRSGEPERLAAVPRLEAEAVQRLDELREHAAGKRAERAATQD